MAIGMGNKAEDTDLGSPGADYVYNRFVTVVMDAFLGTAASTYSNIIWYLGNFPYDGARPELGDRVFATPNPGTTTTQANEINSLVPLFNILHTYAIQISRVRRVVMTYQIDPAADDVQTNLTALTAFYANATLPQPTLANLSLGAKISTAAIDAYFTATKANLDANAAITVAITMCHSSCHVACHGSRGRR